MDTNSGAPAALPNVTAASLVPPSPGSGSGTVQMRQAGTHAPVPDGLAPVWRSGWGLRMKGGTGEAGGLPPSRSLTGLLTRFRSGGGVGAGDGGESCTGVHRGEKEVSGGERSARRELEGAWNIRDHIDTSPNG